MGVYKAKPLSIDEQIQMLIDGGLIISNIDSAKNWLSNVSYHRLKRYTYTFKDDETLKFKNGATFEEVVDLYLFDRSLKLVLFDAIETIEVSIKTLISNLMSLKHGAHWYLDTAHFSSQFDYAHFISKIEEEFAEPEEPGVQAYKKFYSDPTLPPSWMMIEFVTIGTISKIFEHLTDREVKREVCGIFNVPENIFISWLHSFTHQRNRCAHHQRIVYRTIKHDILLPSRIKHKFLRDAEDVSRSSLYCSICCMLHLVKKINPLSSFRSNVLKLISDNPQINFSKMGFIEGWDTEEIWTN
jgi:abortive infection bacteriophage resistance protein